MSVTPEAVTRYLKEQAGVDVHTITPETALFTSNLLDSFSLVDLILFVESEMAGSIDPDDVTIENFDSVDRIVRFARSKQA